MSTTYLAPRQFERRILLLVSGMSPQIVTETLFALSQAQPAFLPTEIHLISTIIGAEQARLNLLSGPKHFACLCQDYGLDANTFSAERISVIQDSTGRELADIRTPAENEATANFITNKVRELTTDAEAALHISIAGGRKTMGYYTGYALSLFGRPQDRLSHVLVSEGYEGLNDFYYPTPHSRTIHDRNGKALDTAKAQISLAEIPFVRLRNGLPKSLLNGAHSFGQTVELANKATEKARLKLAPETQQFWMNDEEGKLSAVLMGLLLWIATRKEPVAPLVEGEQNKQLAQELMSTAQQHGLQLHGKTEISLSTDGVTKAFLETNISKLNKELTNKLGPELAARCRVSVVSHNRSSGYALPESLEVTIQS